MHNFSESPIQHRGPCWLRPGESVDGHTHNRHHNTYFPDPEAKWTAEIVTPEGKPVKTEVVGPAVILIRREHVHKLTFVGWKVSEAMKGHVDALNVIGGAAAREAERYMEWWLSRPAAYVCLFAHYRPDGEPSQYYTGWQQDYV